MQSIEPRFEPLVIQIRALPQTTGRVSFQLARLLLRTRRRPVLLPEVHPHHARRKAVTQHRGGASPDRHRHESGHVLHPEQLQD